MWICAKESVEKRKKKQDPKMRLKLLLARFSLCRSAILALNDILRDNLINEIGLIVNYSVCGRDLLIAKDFSGFCCAICKLNNL